VDRKKRETVGGRNSTKRNLGRGGRIRRLLRLGQDQNVIVPRRREVRNQSEGRCYRKSKGIERTQEEGEEDVASSLGAASGIREIGSAAG